MRSVCTDEQCQSHWKTVGTGSRHQLESMSSQRKIQQLLHIDPPSLSKRDLEGAGIDVRGVTKTINANNLTKIGLDAGALLAAGFDAKRLKASGFSAHQLKAAGLNLQQLKSAGFSAKQLASNKVGFNATELGQAGFNSTQLVSAGLQQAESVSIVEGGPLWKCECGFKKNWSENVYCHNCNRKRPGLKKFSKDAWEVGGYGSQDDHRSSDVTEHSKATSSSSNEKCRRTPFLHADGAVAQIGSIVEVNPTEIRWTHGMIQPLFTCGRPLEKVAEQLKCRELLVSDLPMMELVFYKDKWYSRNNRRLWCFKQSGLSSIQARISTADHYFLKGLNTKTDGWTIDFFPPVKCSSCGSLFPNRKGLQSHYCSYYHDASALDWDYEDVADAESDTESEGGVYGNDGMWYSDETWESTYEENNACLKADEWGRSPMWRAAATGNVDLIFRFIEQKADIDAKDCEGVSPLLVAVRLGQWTAAEALLCAGAFQMPWKLTVRRGAAWNTAKVSTFNKLVSAVNKSKGRMLTDVRFKRAFKNRGASSKSEATARFQGRERPKGFACPECWLTSREWANMVSHIKTTGHAGGFGGRMNDRCRYAALERAEAIASGRWQEGASSSSAREIGDWSSHALSEFV